MNPFSKPPNTSRNKTGITQYTQIDEEGLIASIGGKSFNSVVTTTIQDKPIPSASEVQKKKISNIQASTELSFFFQKRKPGATSKAVISNEHRRKMKLITCAANEGATTISDYLYRIIEHHFETHRAAIKELIEKDNASDF